MNKILFITAFVVVGSITFYFGNVNKPSIPRNVYCWQNHAVIDLPIDIPTNLSEAQAEQFRKDVCEAFFGQSSDVIYSSR